MQNKQKIRAYVVLSVLMLFALAFALVLSFIFYNHKSHAVDTYIHADNTTVSYFTNTDKDTSFEQKIYYTYQKTEDDYLDKAGITFTNKPDSVECNKVDDFQKFHLTCKGNINNSYTFTINPINIEDKDNNIIASSEPVNVNLYTTEDWNKKQEEEKKKQEEEKREKEKKEKQLKEHAVWKNYQNIKIKRNKLSVSFTNKHLKNKSVKLVSNKKSFNLKFNKKGVLKINKAKLNLLKKANKKKKGSILTVKLQTQSVFTTKKQLKTLKTFKIRFGF
jgi:hypothetical protein